MARAARFYQSAVLLDPSSFAPYRNLGVLEKENGSLDFAEQRFRYASILEPTSVEVKHLLAALTGKTTVRAPSTYVKKLFDSYARNFDKSLIDILAYTTPSRVGEILLKIWALKNAYQS